MPERIITSLQNQRIKDAVKLRTARQRAKQGRIVIDGRREILRALEAGIEVTELFLADSPEAERGCAELIKHVDPKNTAVWRVTPNVFEKLAFGDRVDGALAIAIPPRRRLADLPDVRGGLVAVLDGVEKPGNVGAVLRSADGAGVDAVIVANPQTDLYNPNCIRASLGTIFTVPVCQAEPDAVVAWLLKQGLEVVAARVDADRLHSDVDYRGGTAFLLGSEAQGLSDSWRQANATSVRLPMLGHADSLNVSVTAAVLFYEARRQRDAES